MAAPAPRRWAELLGLPARIVVGLMSGTSMDGIDVAVCRIPAGRLDQVELLAAATLPWPQGLAQRLRTAHLADPSELARLDFLAGAALADAAGEVLAGLGLRADLVGSHGQTIAHEHGRTTLQLGEATVLAEWLGCPVVADFRRNDIAAGGCGAPLVPIVDRWLLARPDRAVLAVNLGGIANLTALPPTDQPDRPVIGFDCGPGNMVIDELARRCTGGRASCDRDGAFAAAGTPDQGLLARLLADPVLQAPPPRSLGREQYGAEFVDRLLADHPPKDAAGWCHLIATATELTVQALAGAYREHVAPRLPVAEIVVAGGGVHNRELMRRLAAALAPVPVLASDRRGLDPDHKEAIAFALLAAARLEGVPGNLPEVTGARRPVLLGKVSEC